MPESLGKNVVQVILCENFFFDAAQQRGKLVDELDEEFDYADFPRDSAG